MLLRCGTVSVSDLWPVSPLKTCCNLDNTCSPVCVCLRRHQDSTFMLNCGDEESAHACVRACSHASYLLFNFLRRLVSFRENDDRTNRSSVRWKSKQEVDEKLTDFCFIKDHFTVTTNTDIVSISSDTSIQDTIETSLHHAGWSFSKSADVCSSGRWRRTSSQFSFMFLKTNDSACCLMCAVYTS